MHWYGGSIAEAVTLSKQRNAIFVVFVEGDNDLSAEMAATIDDSAVLNRLSNQANFLAVKLKSGSANYIHFAQIYQFVPVPSLFFIGRNGTPLEVVCAGVQPRNLAVRIDRILEEHFKDKQPSPTEVQPSTSSSNIHEHGSPNIHEQGSPNTHEQGATNVHEQTSPNIHEPTSPTIRDQESPNVRKQGSSKIRDQGSANIREQTVNFVQTESAAMSHQAASDEKPKAVSESASGSPRAKIPKTDHQETKPGSPEQDVVCDGDVCMRRPRVKPDEPGPSQAPTPSLPNSPVDPQASLLPTTDSLGSMEEKMERAKELIEARRREKADKEKELEKEKEMERRASGKGVAELKRWQADQELKQIQEERRREKMENNLARQRILEQIAQDRLERRARDQPQTNQPQQSVQPAPTSGDGGGRARIQFKLPDGTSHTAHFDADGTLGEVQRYVADNLQMSTSSFALWTAFPRRELTDADASLRGLQLAPSAALLVLPRRTAATVARPSAVSTIITFFTQLFTTIILEPSQTVLIWLRTRLFPPPATSPRAARSPSPLPPTPPTAPVPSPPAPPGGLRRRGNIHRLPSDRTPDDDNNTWNGNSTQQM